MVFENYTPFPAIGWENVDAKNHWHITTMARVRYIPVPDAEGRCALKLHTEQGELFFEESFYGVMGQSSVRYENDLVTFKPTTDIIVHANAYIPKHRSYIEPVASVLDADGAMYHQCKLHVRSPYDLSDHPVAVPLRYEYARGGGYPLPTEEDPYNYETLDPYNPIGKGVYDAHTPVEQREEPYITFSDPDLEAAPYPAGFGVIYKAWKSRLMYAGTYDEQWLREQHPLPPHEYDYRFNQAANPAMQLERYLDLNDTIVLEHLSLQYPRLQFDLSDLVLFSQQHTPQNRQHFDAMHLDTLIIDMESSDPEEWSLYASYRSFVPRHPAYQKVSCHMITQNLLAGEDNG
jgi:hypothetical protein